VVLDEPFKASSAILNVMLSIINERVFDNGGTRIDVPMIALYGASTSYRRGAELSACGIALQFAYRRLREQSRFPAPDPDGCRQTVEWACCA